VRYLWGEDVDDDEDLPPVEPTSRGEMPGSLRVAVASNRADNLDGHFGSAPRFLIYQVGKDKSSWSTCVRRWRPTTPRTRTSPAPN
jgi:nitrogen fixation protein NifX